MLNKLFGFEIVVSEFMPPPGSVSVYPDWSARLNRNLSRRSTGLWEPLHTAYPDVIMIDNKYIMSPQSFAVLKNLARG